jgi:hypothetical protein
MVTALFTCLLALGAACLLTALFGGSVKAGGFELLEAPNGGKRAIVGLIGVAALVGVGFIYRHEGQAAEAGAVRTYQRQMLATCGRLEQIRMRQFPAAALNEDGQVKKTAVVRHLSGGVQQARAELERLWARQPPTSLEANRRTAKRAAERHLAHFGWQLAHIKRQMPMTISFEQLSDWWRADSKVAAQYNAAMAALAGQNCTNVNRHPPEAAKAGATPGVARGR